jgi:hypothetical protein
MSDAHPKSYEQVLQSLESVRAWLRRLIIAVVFLALATSLTMAVVFGYLLDFHAGEAAVRGGVPVGTAVLGFGFGLFAGRIRLRGN